MTSTYRGSAPAPTVRYRLRGAAPGAFVRQGVIAGLLVALPPGIGVAILAGYLIRAARGTLETWRAVRIPLPLNQFATVNMVDLLHLSPLLAQLRAWDGSAWLVPGAIVLAALAAGALLGAAVSLVLVLLLNLSARAGGGITLELERLPDE